MTWVIIIGVLLIYCMIPLPFQILIFIGDIMLTGFGADEILLIIAMIVRRFMKD